MEMLLLALSSKQLTELGSLLRVHSKQEINLMLFPLETKEANIITQHRNFLLSKIFIRTNKWFYKMTCIPLYFVFQIQRSLPCLLFLSHSFLCRIVVQPFFSTNFLFSHSLMKSVVVLDLILLCHTVIARPL